MRNAPLAFGAGQPGELPGDRLQHDQHHVGPRRVGCGAVGRDLRPRLSPLLAVSPPLGRRWGGGRKGTAQPVGLGHEVGGEDAGRRREDEDHRQSSRGDGRERSEGPPRGLRWARAQPVEGRHQESGQEQGGRRQGQDRHQLADQRLFQDLHDIGAQEPEVGALEVHAGGSVLEGRGGEQTDGGGQRRSHHRVPQRRRHQAPSEELEGGERQGQQSHLEQQQEQQANKDGRPLGCGDQVGGDLAEQHGAEQNAVEEPGAGHRRELGECGPHRALGVGSRQGQGASG